MTHYDLSRCACGNLIHFFARTVAEQRGQPQKCWTCQREEQAKDRSVLVDRIVRRPPTVVRGFDPDGPKAA